MLPFIISTMFFVIAMPRPELPYLLVVEESSWAKVSNSLGRNSLLMPIPVSAMVKRRVVWFSNCARRSTVSSTFPPSGVNLTALPRMLMSTWRSFIMSPM